jgi:hypothetical protein
VVFLRLCDDFATLVGPGANSGEGIAEDWGVAILIPVEELFNGDTSNQEIVVLCVRWYLSYELTYRDLVEMMSERGIDLAHTTIYLNNIIEQDHRRIKQGLRPMLGLKAFPPRPLISEAGRNHGKIPEIWQAALAA